MKDGLIERVIEILKEGGFIISKRCAAKSFDLAARRGDTILLIKILHNIDGFGQEVAKSIKQLAFYLLASPIVVGERKSYFFLEDGVVYQRYDVPVINASTLYDYFVEGIPPCVYSAPGGLYVNIDGEVMKEVRMRKNMSLEGIAAELGVSRRSVSKYEDEEMSTTIDMALKLEEILDAMLIEPLDFLNTKFELSSARVSDTEPEVAVTSASSPIPSTTPSASSLETFILNVMKRIGFDVFATAHAPFSAVSQLQSEPVKILTGISKYTPNITKKAKIVSSLSYITKTKAVFVINGKIKQMQIEKTVLIKKDELLGIRDAEELTGIMEERMKNRASISV
jgi:putative transcriptional regulator